MSVGQRGERPVQPTGFVGALAGTSVRPPGSAADADGARLWEAPPAARRRRTGPPWAGSRSQRVAFQESAGDAEG